MGAHAVELFPGRARPHALQRGRARDGRLRDGARRVRAAWEAGRVEHVWVDETRPLLQGGRLTAWELEQLGIPHAVIADGAAASFMARGEVDLVVTGADRIAANGDTANKIGTYGLAVLAAHHGSRSSWSRRRRRSTRRGATGDGDPDRGARRRRGDGPLPGAEPRRSTSRRRSSSPRSSPSTASTVRRTRVAAPRGRGRAMILDEVDPGTRGVARALRVRRRRFEALRAGRSGELSAASNVVAGSGRAARGEGDVTRSRSPDRRERAAARRGLDALVAGGSRRSCSPAGWRRASAGS